MLPTKKLGKGKMRHFHGNRYTKAKENPLITLQEHVEDNILYSSCASPPALVVEPIASDETQEEFKIEGRRILHFSGFIKQLEEAVEHGPMACQLSHLEWTSETKLGLRSEFHFRCKLCGYTGKVRSDFQDKVDVNTAAVSGALSIGIGHSQLEELMNVMEVPCMSSKTFTKYEDKVHENLLQAASKEMEAAAKEEAEIARQIGDVDDDGVPLITVQADGSWGKRSYGTKYDSLSGLAVIIGCKTKKVLFMGVKNKYCCICARAMNRVEDPPQHKCFKNWQGSSSSMEAGVILEGFTKSESMYGVRYARIIADGDSTVYNKLVKTRPYPNRTIEKIECTNHLLRNFCRKIRALCTNKHMGPSKLRKILEGKVRALRGVVNKASNYWSKTPDADELAERVSGLKMDIFNAPNHVFGDHSKCKGYYCKGEVPSDDLIQELKDCGLWSKIHEIISILAFHSRSLVHRLNSNLAENFNSQISKVVGGKRINFAIRGSYKARCLSAVVSHNTRRVHSTLHRAMCLKSPGTYTKKLEMRRAKAVLRKAVNPRRRNLFGKVAKDEDYGPFATHLKMDDKDFEEAKNIFMTNLALSKEERKEMNEKTKSQSSSYLWKEERRKRLTASNFGAICKRRLTTSCVKLVQRLLYAPELDTPATIYGKEMEIKAVSYLQNVLNMKVEPSGLIVHKSYPFLGASPDGLIGNDSLLEIKCPFVLRDQTLEESVTSKKINFLKKNERGEYVLDRKHNYFYQVQGQMEAADRRSCLFIVFSPRGVDHMENVPRDQEFWNNKMVQKLQEFYTNCVLPELVDPGRITRSEKEERK